MAIDEFDLDEIRSHLNVYWLRPESAVWDIIAAKRIGRFLRGKQNILELGIGNGYFSFLMLGGKFKPEFDWFYNVSYEGFWDNKDIFDHDSGISGQNFIEKSPETRISFGLDHKQNLLNQAERLGFVDKLVVHDCNKPILVRSFSTVFSNMLYWLDDPINVIHQIGNVLPKGGELITVFPNRNFFKYCQSYNGKTEILRLLNRGRSSHIMWCMDLQEFENEIDKSGIFEMSFSTRYLSPTIMKAWDIGLRPLSIPLIKMANALSSINRSEIKQEWCDTLQMFLSPLLEDEMNNGENLGGFNLVVLVKR